MYCSLIPGTVWTSLGLICFRKRHSYLCIVFLPILNPYEEGSMQMWLYCFQAWTGTSRQVCRALWNLMLRVSTLPHALLCSLTWANIHVESMGQEISCRLGKPTSCLLGNHALIPCSEVFFLPECRPPWYIFYERRLLAEESFAISSPKKGKCVVTLSIRHKACIYYAEVVLNKVLHRKGSGNRAVREVPTLAAARSSFQSLTSFYIVIPLQVRNTAWYPQLGQ